MPDHYDDLLPEDLAKLLDNQQAVNRLAGLRFAGQAFGPAANVLATPPQDIAKRSLTGGVTGILDILGNLQRDVAGTTNRLDQRFPELGIGQADPQFSGDPLRSGLGLTPGAPDELFEMFGPDLPFGKLAGLFGTAKILKLGGKAEIARRKAGKDFAVASKDIDELNRTVLGPLETDFFQKYGFAHRDAPRGRAVAAEIATTRGGTMSVEARKQWVDTYLKDVGQIDEALNRRFEMLTRQAGLEQDIFRIDSAEAAKQYGFDINATEWGDDHVQTAMRFLQETDSPEEALKQLDIAAQRPPEGPLLDAWRGRDDELEELLTTNKMARNWLKSKIKPKKMPFERLQLDWAGASRHGPLEVLQNPSPDELGQFRRDIRTDYLAQGMNPNAEPLTRMTQDANGNKWYWRADMGTHGGVEDLLKKQFLGDITLNQNQPK